MGPALANAPNLIPYVSPVLTVSYVTKPGIFKLGEKLEMDATEDIRILVLLWKMMGRTSAAAKPGEMSKEEWLAGCSALEFDSWARLETLKPSLDLGFLDAAEFKDFYKFCFQFNRQGTHRTLDKELVVALLELVLKDSMRVAPDRLDTFCDFLKQNPITHITADQWVSFLDFCQEVPDLSAYDESSSAWPVLIDEYVEYMEGLKKDGSKK